MDKMNLEHAISASYLLPDPGGAVARELITRIRALEAEVGRRVRQIEAKYHVQRKLKERVEAVEYKYYDMLKHCFALADELVMEATELDREWPPQQNAQAVAAKIDAAKRLREIAEGREENPEWPDDWPDKETVDRLTRESEGGGDEG